MKVQFPKARLVVAILLMLLENHRTNCLRRLFTRKLTANDMSVENVNDIREILASSLNADLPRVQIKNEKRSIESLPEDDNNNVASDSKDASIYEDETGEEDEGQRGQIDEVDEYKRNANALDQSELGNYDESNPKNVKDVAKREVRNEDDYDEDDFEADSESIDSPAESDSKINEVARSTFEEGNFVEDNLKKIDTPRDSSAVAIEDNLKKIDNPSDSGALFSSDLDYEKEIEDQIQQRIDAIKEDIKRQIERKQQAREIEANNAKFDELEFSRDEDEEMAAPSDSKRSASSNSENTRVEAEKSASSVRSKRRSADLDEVPKNSPQPMKKRSYAKRVTLEQKRDAAKRRDRSAIIIPERSHVEVRDDLPEDLSLDSKLRFARSHEKKKETEGSRSTRSAPKTFENPENETPEGNSFLFAPREVRDPKIRLRRGRGGSRSRSLDREEAQKHPRNSRRHRVIREFPIEDANVAEERDKRAMSSDENTALEYKESFGGFPSESGGALGRFKRIKRSAKIA